MNIFRLILCPVDFSEFSTLALRYAVAFARSNHSRLIVQHTVPDLAQPISYMDANYLQTVNEVLTSSAKRKLLDYIEERVPTDITTSARVEIEDPADSILRVAAEEQAGLIVMGTRGWSGEEPFVIGSVTNKLLHRSRIPVLVVYRPTHHFIQSEERPIEIRRMVCPLDLETETSTVRDLALAVAQRYTAELILLHVSMQQGKEAEYETRLKKMISAMPTNSSVSFQVKMGDPSKQILQIIREREIDLVVMGHRSRKHQEEMLLGSVARRVIADSPCPVMVQRIE